MSIPMVDLKIQYHQLKAEIDQAIAGVLESTAFILGPNVRALEDEIAAYLGVRHAISCANGTEALHLALRAAGIGPGDEVITPPFTFIATAEAIRYVGAQPVFVDIDAHTYNLNPALVAAAITPRTKALMPVHLFGQPADLSALAALADRHNLRLIEDCAQSFGASLDGRQTGSFGVAGCFSFFPSKNLGCYGDGGLVSTTSDTVADHLKSLRNHGSRVRYHHDEIGYNSRLDEIQAAILRVKLKHIDAYNDQRRRVAHRYNELLADTGVALPHEDGLGRHVFHQYTLRSPHRDAVLQALTAAGIANAVYYPIPLHRQKVFAEDYAGVSLPVSEAVAADCFSLPIFPEMSDAQIVQVTDVIRAALG
ncbi:MAG: DegT/DnrJ/EryC1/StrS family aminotransferase [Thiotrichales bacterium]